MNTLKEGDRKNRLEGKKKVERNGERAKAKVTDKRSGLERNGI